MPEPDNVELIAELHRRQRRMYAGGPTGPVGALLSEDVVWHVPLDLDAIWNRLAATGP